MEIVKFDVKKINRKMFDIFIESSKISNEYLINLRKKICIFSVKINKEPFKIRNLHFCHEHENFDNPVHDSIKRILSSTLKSENDKNKFYYLI